MTQAELQQILKFATDLTREVGLFLKSQQTQVSVLNYKDKQDILTNLDLEAEKKFISAISGRFPNHSIYSEEKGLVEKDLDYMWFIDPIDGTKEYLRQLPLYSTTITMAHNSETLVATNYYVMTDQMFSATLGGGASRNGVSLKVSTQSEVDKSFIFARFPDYRAEDELSKDLYEKLRALSRLCYRIRGVTHENIDLCGLSMGASEAYLLLKGMNPPKWYDLASGLLIAEQAGATATDVFGDKIVFGHRPMNGLLVTNGLIHQPLLELISSS